LQVNFHELGKLVLPLAEKWADRLLYRVKMGLVMHQ
jgi:hypothetical protein